MGGRGTHITCKVTLTALSHFGDHRAACKSTEKGSGGPEIYSALGVPGPLQMRTTFTYHFPIPLQINQKRSNTSMIPGNLPHCSPRAAARGPTKWALRRERNWVGPHYI